MVNRHFGWATWRRGGSRRRCRASHVLMRCASRSLPLIAAAPRRRGRRRIGHRCRRRWAAVDARPCDAAKPVALDRTAAEGKVARRSPASPSRADRRRWGQFHVALEPRAAGRRQRHADHRRPAVPARRARRLGVEPRPAAGTGDHRRGARSPTRCGSRRAMRPAGASSTATALDGAPTAIDAAAAAARSRRWQNRADLN